MRLDHAIFQGPLKPTITFQEDDWGKDFDARGLWTVQTGELGTGKGNDFGLVSTGFGFEDSPDCERISGGKNSKGPAHIAIGRQANLLQWGFYAAPDRMTESARQVFLNSIVYMRRFDGHRPLVEQTTSHRDWLGDYIDLIRNRLPTMPEGAQKGMGDYLLKQFPKSLTDKVGLDADALEAWTKKHIEFIHAPAAYQLTLDGDLAKLGLSNRDPKFLVWLEQSLKLDAKDALALSLAERYLDGTFADTRAILAHLETWRGRLFFSDQGGFRWFKNPLTKHPAAN